MHPLLTVTNSQYPLTNMDSQPKPQRTCKVCAACNQRLPKTYLSQEAITEATTNTDNYHTSPQNWVTVHFSRWDSALPEPALMTRVAEYIRTGRGDISSYPKNRYLSWCYSVGVDRAPGLDDQDVLDRAARHVEELVVDIRAGRSKAIDLKRVFVNRNGEYIFSCL